MHPGARPEEAFGPRRVYTLHVNTPNLNSASGSWILNFVELRGDPSVRPLAGELSGPVPLRKVDPKYPPALVSEKVEGEVVLYAVIRKDGSVDSIQLIHGIDAQLDNNAMQALSKWKFRPAEHQGVPVELEAIVHIPFRAVARPY
jgi:TonB family protein